MYIYRTSDVIYIKLLVLYITSINALPQNNINTTSNSNIVKTNNISNMSQEGGGKLAPLPTNVTIIPGPNLDGVLSDHTPVLSSTIKKALPVDTKDDAVNFTTVVLSEGGGKTNTDQSVNKNIPAVLAIDNRNLDNINANLSSSVININKSVTNVAMEGGGEHKLIKDPVNNGGVDLKKHEIKTDVATTLPRTIPVSEAAESTKKIVPRKGVNNLDYKEEFLKAENITAKPVIKKPLFTEASEDELSVETRLEENSNSTTHVEVKQKVPSLDRFHEFSNNTQQYVIPIVIVILSVPLVAVIISFLLKRGAEWWKYRHYRRMDFLINGIYDT